MKKRPRKALTVLSALFIVLIVAGSALVFMRSTLQDRPADAPTPNILDEPRILQSGVPTPPSVSVISNLPPHSAAHDKITTPIPPPSQPSIASQDTPLTTNELLAVLGDPSLPRQDRVYAAHVLGKQRVKDAFPLFMNILADPSEPLLLRYKAVRGLGVLGNTNAITSLDAILSDASNDRHLRVVSALALGNLGTGNGMRSLSKATADEDELIRFKAIQGLGRTGDVKAKQPIMAALADADPYVQARAIHSLGETGDADSAPVIIAMLDETESDFTKIACIEALGQIGGETALMALKKCTSSDNELLRANAVRAIERLKERIP